MSRDRARSPPYGGLTFTVSLGPSTAGEMVQRRLEALGILDLERVLDVRSDDLPASRSSVHDRRAATGVPGSS